MSKQYIPEMPTLFDANRDEQAQDLLIRARVAMIRHHPFWGIMALRLKLVNADNWCSTLATDGKHFYYNSKFVTHIGDTNKLMWGFAHETLHCVYDHMQRTESRDPKLSNIAQDFVINGELYQFKVGTPIDEVKICFDKKYFGWTFEEVYDDLLKNQKKINIDQLADMVFDMHLDKANADGEGQGGDGEGSGPPKISDEDREKIRNDIRDALVEATKAAMNDADKGAGNIPGGIQRFVKDLLNPKLDWKSLINVKTQSLIKHDYTYRKLNRKYMSSGFIFPGQDQSERIDIDVAIDTSGSISNEQLKEILSEVAGIMQSYEDYQLRIWQFDTKVYGYDVFTSDDGRDILSYEVYGGGGTNFVANWEFMKAEGIEPELFIVFTDGEPFGSWGDPEYCDTLWIINNKYRKVEPPFGQFAYYE